MPQTLLSPVNPPKPGQIGLVQGSGFWSKVIGAVTRSTVTHTLVALEDGTCIGAEPGGAHVRPISYFTGQSTPIWSDFDLTEDEQADIVAHAHAFEGTPYSYLDDLLVGLTLLFGDHTPLWIKRRIWSTGHLQCAQLADTVYTWAGVHLFKDGRQPGAVYPASYVPIFEQNGWVK